MGHVLLAAPEGSVPVSTGRSSSVNRYLTRSNHRSTSGARSSATCAWSTTLPPEGGPAAGRGYFVLHGAEMGCGSSASREYGQAGL